MPATDEGCESGGPQVLTIVVQAALFISILVLGWNMARKAGKAGEAAEAAGSATFKNPMEEGEME